MSPVDELRDQRTVKQTLATWTVLETVLSIVGFAAAAVAWAIV